MTDDIHHIWKAVLAGDSAAWCELVRLYSGLVFTVARRVGLSDFDAEDCAQHTWMALFRRRRAIKDPVGLPAWLIRTTHRQAVHTLRRLSRHTALETTGAEGGCAELPDAAVQQLEHRVMLEVAIRRLDARCRKLLVELFLSDRPRSYLDVARSLRIKPNSLGPLRSRCLGKLKRLLKKMGYEQN